MDYPETLKLSSKDFKKAIALMHSSLTVLSIALIGIVGLFTIAILPYPRLPFTITFILLYDMFILAIIEQHKTLKG